ncbi:hypothetical protein QN089_09195 [Kurthia sp. YJT4]|uniref:hypothetical protein n=1 Tax=Kurthia sp. YJT4 TaxID=3049086 RepID=UPI002551A8E0|nr:hypothetical protein [Kurthia sp. YJT4]WIL37531.1 hypothetical protein QN089_09195 [Kurthia sp. YJT4]
MKYLKIININPKGMIDYKTLDINQFVAGTQVYDLENGVCLVKTSEDNYTPHADIIELTEAEYNEQRDIINSMSPQVQEKNEIDELKAENEALKASQLEQDTLIMELILGGAV